MASADQSPSLADASENKAKKSDGWAYSIFEEFIAHSTELSEVLELSIRGISMIQSMPQALEALARWNEVTGEGTEISDAEVEHAKQLAALSQREVILGFPILHAQSLVLLWGSLESLVRNLLAKLIENKPAAKEVSQVQKLRISIGDYESLDKEDRCYYILDILEKEIQAPYKRGVSRFEALLEIFGLDGPISEDVRRDLYEISELRNDIVHRRGIADKKLIAGCPWLGLRAGEPIKITHHAFHRYAQSVDIYATELLTRLVVYYGTPREKFEELIRNRQSVQEHTV